MINILRKQLNHDKARIVSLPLYMIAPNPNQPRKYFDSAAMEELKNSILEYGLIQPITVRCAAGGEYELVAGERRFRAAQMAGLEEIPAVIIEADNDKSAIMALLENLQREDLSFFEIAESYKNLIRDQGLTQTELALRVGKSQASVANKMRLLRLPPLVKKLIRDYDLSERHARALLLLGDEEKQFEAVKIVCRDNLNVTQTEQLVRSMNARKLKPIDELRVTKANDVKVFKNTMERALKLMKKGGIEAEIEENAFDWGTEYIIKIKK
ncbi:MAG: ParB/RepB/Spo0J family partition protein [Oscillospiraceae bacterium]|nr:ParB/RepB/Spo0J family partition protein [Oscillospiraceae bacterium]